MTKRKYTGTSDGVSKGKRSGTTEWINQVIALSNNVLWNNGDFVVRNMRGKESLSVHATGRAVDLSYRHIPAQKKGKPNSRKAVIVVMRKLIANADLIGLEMILDYFPSPFGRGWRCDRRSWVKYQTRVIGGAPMGDWIHCEISPEFADNPQKVKDGFAAMKPLDFE